MNVMATVYIKYEMPEAGLGWSIQSQVDSEKFRNELNSYAQNNILRARSLTT